MYGNRFGVHFLLAFIFLLITREVCVSIYTNRREHNYFCELRWNILYYIYIIP